MSDLRKDVEAVLFAVGKKIPVADIARIVKAPDAEVLRCLAELQQEYTERESPMLIISEGDSWKMTVRERYMPLVRAIIPETELPKSVLETLAVIAWKAPVLQSVVVEMRSTKAYEHVSQLEALGFVARERSGRSFRLTLTQKFLDYFDLTGVEQIQQKFQEFGDVVKLVEMLARKKPEDEHAPSEMPEVPQ